MSDKIRELVYAAYFNKKRPVPETLGAIYDIIGEGGIPSIRAILSMLLNEHDYHMEFIPLNWVNHYLEGYVSKAAFYRMVKSGKVRVYQINGTKFYNIFDVAMLIPAKRIMAND